MSIERCGSISTRLASRAAVRPHHLAPNPKLFEEGWPNMTFASVRRAMLFLSAPRIVFGRKVRFGSFSSDQPAPDALGMFASLRSRPNLRTAAVRRLVPGSDICTAASRHHSITSSASARNFKSPRRFERHSFSTGRRCSSISESGCRHS